MRSLQLFALALLCAMSFPASYGLSRISIQRTWTVNGAPGSDFELLGAVAANNSNQRIVSITSEPPMEIYTQDGVVWAKYQGKLNGTESLTVNAIVDIDYNTNITTDPPLPTGSLNATNLTSYDLDMKLQAERISDAGSSLKTIRDLVNWVHSYVTYDISYWGKTKSAEDVFLDKRGVCVEYTHLLIALARSLGFDTRYVSGYVYTDNWQPHAWAEIYVPGYGWLPADATFGQVGVLDDTHLAIHYGADQSSAYDTLLARDQNATVSADDQLETSFQSQDDKGTQLSLSVDNHTYVSDAKVTNNNPGFVFGSFAFSLPKGYGDGESSVMLLGPDESTDLYSGINRSLIQSGYSYSIPISASFNDAHDEKTLSVIAPLVSPSTPSVAGPCNISFLMLLIPAAALIKWPHT